MHEGEEMWDPSGVAAGSPQKNKKKSRETSEGEPKEVGGGQDWRTIMHYGNKRKSGHLMPNDEDRAQRAELKTVLKREKRKRYIIERKFRK